MLPDKVWIVHNVWLLVILDVGGPRPEWKPLSSFETGSTWKTWTAADKMDDRAKDDIKNVDRVPTGSIGASVEEL